MPDVKQLTNGELLIEIRNNTELKEASIEELDSRMEAAKVKLKKGFDTPPAPPIP